jgi:hypothetical protein
MPKITRHGGALPPVRKAKAWGVGGETLSAHAAGVGTDDGAEPVDYLARYRAALELAQADQLDAR